MCDKCDAKAYELDQKHPHFIDGLHSGKIPSNLNEADFLAAVKEYRRFVIGRHGKQ